MSDLQLVCKYNVWNEWNEVTEGYDLFALNEAFKRLTPNPFDMSDLLLVCKWNVWNEWNDEYEGDQRFYLYKLCTTNTQAY